MKQSFIGGTLFVDHASDFVYVSFHETSDAQLTVSAKHKFERLATENGRRIKHYHAYNQILNSRLF